MLSFPYQLNFTCFVLYIYNQMCVSMCACVCMRACVRIHLHVCVEARGQLVEVSFPSTMWAPGIKPPWPVPSPDEYFFGPRYASSPHVLFYMGWGVLFVSFSLFFFKVIL